MRGRVGAIGVFAFASACVHSDSVPCTNAAGIETICPAGTVCVYATPEVTACGDRDARTDCRGAGIADGELCREGSGRCYDGACLPIRCGDSLIDMAGEMCDDGNTIAKDGCAADCRSDEACGTGVVDPIVGEVCDDSNRFSHDGCDSLCQLEVPDWRPITPENPPPVVGSSMVFDPISGRAVLFGGLGSTAAYLFGPRGWTSVTPSIAPPPRIQSPLAYDAARNRVVMFGGHEFQSTFGDHWEWDGTWTFILSTLNDATLPTPRGGHGLVYDPRRNKVVMFGGVRIFGIASSEYFDDLWEWDGTTWSQRMVVGPRPSARSHHAMAYDPKRGVSVVFGGNHELTTFGDTWEWDGTAWRDVSIGGPVARYGATMVAFRDRLVMYGGQATTTLQDTWSFDGVAWTEITGADAGQRWGHAMATDTVNDRILVHGGSGAVTETYAFDGANWDQVKVGVPPAPSSRMRGVFDPTRGGATVVIRGTTYELVSDAWLDLSPSPPLPERDNFAMVYDLGRHETLVFGGSTPTLINDTWTMREVAPGSHAWTQRSPALRPSPRILHSLVYDRARSEVILFGGNDGVSRNDTWVWNGTTWAARTVANPPPPRSSAALAYDQQRQRVVLFGGFDTNNTELSDTWLWDGTTWTKPPAVGTRPLPRRGASLAWNPIRRRLVMFGGTAAQIASLDDTWEWDGARWTRVPTISRPPARRDAMLVPASDGKGMILYGGETTVSLSDIWELRWQSDTPGDRCLDGRDTDRDALTGCADPDCWTKCTPGCGPGDDCAMAMPRCGDSVADAHETCKLCPIDVGMACPTCGDHFCETPAESGESCPGDCVRCGDLICEPLESSACPSDCPS